MDRYMYSVWPGTDIHMYVAKQENIYVDTTLI